MFPDKVERMVVDGCVHWLEACGVSILTWTSVIDPVDYYAAGYQTNLM
jgi:hypothetical protein